MLVALGIPKLGSVNSLKSVTCTHLCVPQVINHTSISWWPKADHRTEVTGLQGPYQEQI